MKIVTDPRLPSQSGLQQVCLKLTDTIRNITNQINNLTEGRVSAVYNAQASVPTAGTNFQGDWVRNATPSEAGTAGSRYVITGWICTVSGSPGTWLPTRSLTGN
jgi:hypothetical protein